MQHILWAQQRLYVLWVGIGGGRTLTWQHFQKASMTSSALTSGFATLEYSKWKYNHQGSSLSSSIAIEISSWRFRMLSRAASCRRRPFCTTAYGEHFHL